MPNCTVRCSDCPPVQGRVKTWHWLCAECATEQRDRHVADTGHTNVVVSIVEEPTMADVRSALKRTHRITGGW